jgi:hypothetical protein
MIGGGVFETKTAHSRQLRTRRFFKFSAIAKALRAPRGDQSRGWRWKLSISSADFDCRSHHFARATPAFVADRFDSNQIKGTVKGWLAKRRAVKRRGCRKSPPTFGIVDAGFSRPQGEATG